MVPVRQIGWCVVVLGAAACGPGRVLPVDEDSVVDGGARPDSNRPTTQHIVEACAFAAACSGWQLTPMVAPSHCVSWYDDSWLPFQFLTFVPSMLKRLLSCAPAKDCQAFETCYGGSWLGSTSCLDGGQCSRDMMWTPSTSAVSLHCDALGGTCAAGSSDACCLMDGCTGSAGANETTCYSSRAGSSTRGSFCHVDRVDFDCASLGQICSTVPYQLCVGPGAACDPETTRVTCTGSVATYCGGGGMATADCAEFTFHGACNAGASSYFPCRPAGAECTVDFTGECQGSSLLVCVDGYKVPVDCASIGFDGCGTPTPDKVPRCMYVR